MGQRCRSLDYGGQGQTAAGMPSNSVVQAVPECAVTGEKQEPIRAHFVVGADGTHSFIRKSIEGCGPPVPTWSPTTQVVSALEPRIEHGSAQTQPLQHLVSVHFHCPQLFDLLQGTGGVGADAMLYFVYNEVRVPRARCVTFLMPALTPSAP